VADSDFEASAAFECFGSTCAVLVSGDTAEATASEAVVRAQRSMLEWHVQFSRFLPESALSRLNADPRETVAVTPLMARMVDSANAVGALTGGLVDVTLIDEIEQAGYAGDFRSDPVELAAALRRAPARAPAGPSPKAAWRTIGASQPALTVTRPPGVKIDSGGIAKGLFADVIAEALAPHAAFAVDCGGDIRIGGTAGTRRAVHVQSPFDGAAIHTFAVAAGAVATSGIGRRSWIGADGMPAHHLLDPASGRPAYTGVVQATAFASTGVLAEALSKAAVLSGPAAVERWLRSGGVVVLDDGTHRVFEPQR
jgi:thiamine biosynthesis lipoprotein